MLSCLGGFVYRCFRISCSYHLNTGACSRISIAFRNVYHPLCTVDLFLTLPDQITRLLLNLFWFLYYRSIFLALPRILSRWWGKQHGIGSLRCHGGSVADLQLIVSIFNYSLRRRS